MLMDLMPLKVRTVQFSSEQLKQFKDKKYMKDLLVSTVIIDENGEFQIPVYDERDLFGLIFKGSKQRRVLPFGFRVVDYEIEYSPLGRAIVTVSAFLINKKPGDGRHPDKAMISEHKVYFVFIEETQKWLWVDMANAKHQNTVTYREREQEEFELTEQFREDYFAYYEQFSRMVNAEVSFTSVSKIKRYLELFADYVKIAPIGLVAYRFFGSISPIEYKYLDKYIRFLADNCHDVWRNFGLINGSEMHELTLDEQEKFKLIKAAAEMVRRFFIPRSEENLDYAQRYGYCPTFKYLEELNRVLIPNAAELERRAAFNSPNFHWSDDKEKEFVSGFILHWFKEDGPEPKVAD